MDEPSKKDTKLSTPQAILVGAVIIAAAIFLVKMPARPATVSTAGTDTTAGPTSDKYANMILATKAKITIPEVGAGDHVRGTEKPKVTIIEYSDTECPFCRVFHSTMQSVMTKYDGKIAWVYRHYPIESLHKKAINESAATECVAKLGGETAFWNYVDLLYKTTPSNDGLDAGKLPEMAKAVGVDVAKFNTCLSAKETLPTITKAISDAQAIGISGTPHSFIIAGNDMYKVEGAMPLASLTAAIDQILK
jgi:protein-disulfide isomerase